MFGLLSRLSSLFRGETQMDGQHDELPPMETPGLPDDISLYEAASLHVMESDEEIHTVRLDHENDSFTTYESMGTYEASTQTGGRILIPAEQRTLLDIEHGDTITAHIDFPTDEDEEEPWGVIGSQRSCVAENVNVTVGGRFIVPHEERERIEYTEGEDVEVTLLRPVDSRSYDEVVEQ